MEFDLAGLPSKITYADAGQPETTEAYSDFRDVSGVKLPFKTNVEQGGQPAGAATVSAYTINTGITPEVIGKRP
jgi:hypothetical protein